MDVKSISTWLLGISAVCAVVAYVAGPVLGIITAVPLLIAVLSAPAAIFIYKYGYWLIPYFTRGQRTVNTKGFSFELSPNEDALVKQEAGEFIATVFLGVKIYKSTTEMSEDEKFGFMDLWERAVSGLKQVTKYGVLLYIKDLQQYLESVENEKSDAQLKLSEERQKPSPDEKKLDLLEREVAMWDNIKEKLAIGEKPTAVHTFVQVSAKGATKDAALAAARTAAKEARSTISTALNVDVVQYSKDDMKRCYDWSLSIPEGMKEI